MTEYTEYAQLPIVLSVEQVAKVLGIGKNTAYELVRSGRIRSVRTKSESPRLRCTNF